MDIVNIPQIHQSLINKNYIVQEGKFYTSLFLWGVRGVPLAAHPPSGVGA